MDLGTPATLRAATSRHEKSLSVLTMKFVALLQQAEDGVLDLKVVSDAGAGGLCLLSRYLAAPFAAPPPAREPL